MPGSLLGNSVRRVEDPDLIRGRGTYTDNLSVDGTLHLVFVRSPFAHARLTVRDTSEAAAAPGVVAVFTAADLGLPPTHPFFVLNPDCPRPPLAQDKVRFVGEPVAAVVAETARQAIDAVELVDVDYDDLPVVADPEAALEDGAPLQFEGMGTNVAAGEREPDGSDVLSDAEVVVRLRAVNQRIAVAPIEGNAIHADPTDDGTHELTVHMATQMPHFARDQIASVFGIDKAKVRVVAPHVGGAFGGKAGLPSEHVVVVAAALRLGRPVKWTETRSEAMLSMHGRAQVQYAELGLRRDGAITGLRLRIVGDAGAYAGFGGALALGPSRMMAQGVYVIPRLSYSAVAAMTNTSPVGAFRGAGRPEAAALLERLMDRAAVELDMDPVELRRRNLIGSDAFPYTTQVGTTYDSGDYSRPLDEAQRIAGYDALRKEQTRRRDNGDTKLLGIGTATYVEITGAGDGEFGSVEVHDDGTVTAMAGTSAHGQGHATSFSMIVADRLKVPLESVRYVQSDTARVARGGGTGGSRSLQLGGNAVGAAADDVLRQGRELAATMLEASIDDVVLGDGGQFEVAGVPTASVSWRDLAAHAGQSGGALAAAMDFEQDGATFPFGAHVAVVEVDVDTGQVTPLRLVAVDDCGQILNPMIVEGQQHGGAAQGIAQALWERFVYADDGTPLTSTFVDYTLPSAVDLPALEVSTTQTPTPLNPLGAKGIGESATIGSTPAMQNAVIDAVAHLGVRHIDMPCTPDRVWAAISRAQAGEPPDEWREPPSVFATLPVRGAAGEDEAAGPDI
ncbi:MAG: xanthine dehydrogenase family protein molybdopterin-binding subunit [Nocardioidaceae bacterium]